LPKSLAGFFDKFVEGWLAFALARLMVS